MDSLLLVQAFMQYVPCPIIEALGRTLGFLIYYKAGQVYDLKLMSQNKFKTHMSDVHGITFKADRHSCESAILYGK